ncbi:LysR substrate-binding domain-containing protein [Streptomyces sp. NPDC059802]|uniref:LysR substrate-binding domain-containing protein n=1 Tax=Streptomyces sp. NPDC059802 TaxID=3346952 RepID=UPI00366399A0
MASESAGAWGGRWRGCRWCLPRPGTERLKKELPTAAKAAVGRSGKLLDAHAAAAGGPRNPPGSESRRPRGLGPQLDDALQNGELDVALSHPLPDRPAYRRRPLRQENFVAVVDANHPSPGGTPSPWQNSPARRSASTPVT